MYWNCVLANWPWRRGCRNIMQTVNNRLMGMALIDKASASEAKLVVMEREREIPL